MTLEQIKVGLDSIANFPAVKGIIGGEPTFHPQFEEMCKIVKESGIPKEQLAIFVSSNPKLDQYWQLITDTFGIICRNDHTEAQKNVCLHQPLTIAVQDVVSDEDVQKQLIEGCWVERTWCGTVNHYGAYFCEIAAQLDLLLFDGANAWDVIKDWWDTDPGAFTEQANNLCGYCGMCLPIQRELIKNTTEKFSEGLYKEFLARGLSKMDDVVIFDTKLTKEEINENIKTWYPGCYRQDIHPDDSKAPEGKGFLGEII